MILRYCQAKGNRIFSQDNGKSYNKFRFTSLREARLATIKLIDSTEDIFRSTSLRRGQTFVSIKPVMQIILNKKGNVQSNLHKALSIIVCGYPIPVKGIHKIRMHYMVFPFISLVRFPAGSQPPDQYIHIKQLHLLMLKKQKLLLFEGICRNSLQYPSAFPTMNFISLGHMLLSIAFQQEIDYSGVIGFTAGTANVSE